MRRMARSGKAACETSSCTTSARTSRALGPGDPEADEIRAVGPDRGAVRQKTLEPAHVVGLGDAGADDEEALVREPRDREIAEQPAVLAEHRREGDAALLRKAVREDAVEELLGLGAADVVFGVGRDLHQPDALAHSPALARDRREGVVAAEAPVLAALFTIGRIPQRIFEPVGRPEQGALPTERFVERRRPERAPGRQLLAGEADAEFPGVVLAHLGVRIGHGGPVAVAGDVHAPDVGAGIALDHPVRQRQADAAALGQAGHHAAGDPVVLEAAHRPDERVAVRREGEGAVDDAPDAGAPERREMLEADLEARRDALEVVLEQLVPEFPGRLPLRPRHAGALVGADQHAAAALLAHVDLAVEVDDMQHLLFGGCNLGHVLGDQVLVLHREHRQLEPGHAADLARPQPAGIDDMLGDERALVGDDVPGAVGPRLRLDDPGVPIDLGALDARRLGIGVGDAGWVDVAFERVVERADEVALVHEREHLRRLVDRDHLHVEAEVPRPRHHHLEEIVPLGRAGEHQPGRDVDAAGLAGDRLDLLVKVDGVGLELGDVRIAVDRVHAAGRVPGRARGQLRALDQHHVAPAGLRQMIKDARADDAPSDDHDAGMGLHRQRLPRNRDGAPVVEDVAGALLPWSDRNLPRA